MTRLASGGTIDSISEGYQALRSQSGVYLYADTNVFNAEKKKHLSDENNILSLPPQVYFSASMPLINKYCLAKFICLLIFFLLCSGHLIGG